jgi:5'-nucleotidase
VNGTYILKSGTDFRQFSTVTLDFSQENLQVDIESVDVTSEYEPDNELTSLLEQYTGTQIYSYHIMLILMY